MLNVFEQVVARMTKGERELEEYDRVFKALAHPSRRHILVVLHARGGQMSAGDIAKRFSCSWPTTTRHLKQLEKSGLLHVGRRGREQIYRLNSEKLNSVFGNWLSYFK